MESLKWRLYNMLKCTFQSVVQGLETHSTKADQQLWSSLCLHVHETMASDLWQVVEMVRCWAQCGQKGESSLQWTGEDTGTNPSSTEFRRALFWACGASRIFPPGPTSFPEVPCMSNILATTVKQHKMLLTKHFGIPNVSLGLIT